MTGHLDVIHSNVFVEERDDGFGHVVIRCAPVDRLPASVQVRRDLLARVRDMVDESVRVSQKRGHAHSYVHVYMRGCTLHNFSIAFYSKMVKTLDGLYDDTLAGAFIYDAPPAARSVWKVISMFIEPKTRKKISMVQSHRETPQLM